MIWFGLQGAFFASFETLTEKLEKLNQQIFANRYNPERLEGLKQEKAALQEQIEALEHRKSVQEKANEAFKRFNELVNEGSATEKVKDFAEQIKKMLAELRAEGDVGAALTVSDEAVIKTIENIQQMTAAQMTGMEQLKAMRDDLILSDQEKLDAWYKLQSKQYIGFEESLALIDEVYAVRQNELDEKQMKENIARHQREFKALDIFRKAEATAIKKADADKIKASAEQEKQLLNIQKVFGIKGFDLHKIINIQDTIANMKAAAMGAYNSLASIPIVGPALGIAAAAAATLYGVGQVAGIKGLSIGGVAHGGLDFVPREQTFLLDRGERVLSPNQNRDLTSALDNGGIGGSVSIKNFIMEILPNATNAEAMINMTREDWEEIASAKVLPAFRTLANQGQTI
jgi:hypothetical protein